MIYHLPGLQENQASNQKFRPMSYILPSKVQQTFHDGLYLKNSIDSRADGFHLDLTSNRSGSIDLSSCFYFHLPQGISMSRNRKRRLRVNLDGSELSNAPER